MFELQFGVEWFKNAINFRKREKKFDEEIDYDANEQPIAVGYDPTILQARPPVSYGIKKKVTLGVAAVFVVALVSSFMYSINPPKNSKQNANLNGSDTPALGKSTTGRAMEQLPNDYSGLGQYNNKGQQTLKNGQPVNPNYTPPGGSSAQYYAGSPPVASNYSYPSNSSGYGSSAPYMPYYPQVIDPAGGGMARNNNATSAQDENDFTKSPIRFAMNLASNVAATALNNSGTSTGQVNTPSESEPANYTMASDYALQAGTIIPATLLTGINSDLQGQVVAQVRENVYDSVSGQYLLIPQGARLIGEYGGSKIGTGQERINVVWKRLIFPNGASVDLGSMISIDGAGYAGLKDQVDNHEGQVIGATLLSSVLSAAAQIAAGNTSGINESAGQLAVSGAASSLMTAGSKMVEKDLTISPTIMIQPGIWFEVFVNKDMTLRPY